MYTKGDIFYDMQSNVWGQIIGPQGAIIESLCLPGSAAGGYTEQEAFTDMNVRLDSLLSPLNRKQS